MDKHTTQYLDEMTDTERAEFDALLDAVPVGNPTERIVQEGRPDVFQKGPYTWQRTRR